MKRIKRMVGAQHAVPLRFVETYLINNSFWVWEDSPAVNRTR